jgi:hypothetical protein
MSELYLLVPRRVTSGAATHHLRAGASSATQIRIWGP